MRTTKMASGLALAGAVAVAWMLVSGSGRFRFESTEQDLAITVGISLGLFVVLLPTCLLVGVRVPVSAAILAGPGAVLVGAWARGDPGSLTNQLLWVPALLWGPGLLAVHVAVSRSTASSPVVGIAGALLLVVGLVQSPLLIGLPLLPQALALLLTGSEIQILGHRDELDRVIST